MASWVSAAASRRDSPLVPLRQRGPSPTTWASSAARSSVLAAADAWWAVACAAHATAALATVTAASTAIGVTDCDKVALSIKTLAITVASSHACAMTSSAVARPSPARIAIGMAARRACLSSLGSSGLMSAPSRTAQRKIRTP